MDSTHRTGFLEGLLRDVGALRLVDEHIYSVLPPGESEHRYDIESGFYDRLVGNRLYLRTVWNNRPEHFSRFAERAVRASGDGPYLDAGCGSLLFTAQVYARNFNRPMVLADKSLGMLGQARKKLVKLAGRLPENVTLLQADLLDMPFLPGRFPAVMCMGLLHIFADPCPLVRGLRSQVAPGGCLYMTSLVLAGRTVGDRYLSLLERSGQIAHPRTDHEVIAALQRPECGENANPEDQYGGGWDQERNLAARRGNSLFLILRRAAPGGARLLYSG